MIGTALALLLLFIIVGVPVSIGIGMSGLLAIALTSDVPLFMVAQQMIRGINSFPLMAIPLFILAGEIMSGAKLSDLMISFARSLVSWMTGGLGMVCVVANMIFAGVTGSGAAAISAVGGLTGPELQREGYSRPFVASLIGGSGALGPVIPPSMNMIVIGSVTGVSVGRMFMGGFLPGLLIGACLMALCYLYARRHHIDTASGKFDLRMAGEILIKALPALIMPAIILAGVAFGVFTATEAGVVACVYGLLCGLFIYRTVKLRDLFQIFRRSSETSAMLLLIMSTGSVWSYIFARDNVADKMSSFVLSIAHSPMAVFAIVMGIMLIVGCFMETLSATVVLLPIFWPIILTQGIDPVQFCVTFTIATVMGGLTPPVGSYLFLSMAITESPFSATTKRFIPIILIYLAVMLLMMFIPQISTLLPNLLMGPL